jgi:hypothetical protein
VSDEWNKDPGPSVWVKTVDEILETLAAYRSRINSSGRPALTDVQRWKYRSCFW